MSNIRRAAKRDANEPDIVRALEAVGATVERLNGTDIPDLLVGFRGVNYLLEAKRSAEKGKSIKTLHAELSDGQADWHKNWRGLRPSVVRSPDEALRAIGVELVRNAEQFKADVPPSK